MDKHKPIFIILIVITVILIIAVAIAVWLIKIQPEFPWGGIAEKESSQLDEGVGQKKIELPPSPAEKEKQRIKLFEGPSNEIALTAKKWFFEPSAITASLGEKVIIKATSSDVAHGFALPGFQIRERIEPGQTTLIEFIADQAGEFDFFSHIYSGPEYRQMRGKLIIK